MKENFNYQHLTDRHKYIIDNININLIEKIKNTKILFAGCGLGSNICELAARVGFRNFTLIDDDKIELSNINRQKYSWLNVGEKKVDVLKNSIFSINPEANIITYDKRITNDQIKEIYSGHEIIINTIDIDETFFSLSDIGSSNSLVIIPMNVIFSTFILLLDGKSEKLYSYFNNSFPTNEIDFITRFIKVNELPEYFKKYIANIESIKKLTNFPQIGITASYTSAMTLIVMLKYLCNLSIPMSPTPIFQDIFQQPIKT